MKISKRTVDAASVPANGDYFLWDNEHPGFGLRVYSNGTKIYVIQYRKNGRTRRLSLGRHGILTPEEARKAAREKLAQVIQGGDPAESRREERNAPTVAELAERYMSEHAQPKKKPSSVKGDEGLLKRMILPALGRRKVTEVSRADVARMHHDHRKTPVQANRAVALLSKMMNLAERWGLRPDGVNPCRHVDKFKERHRTRFLSPAELAQLGRALSETEKRGDEHPSMILAIRLLVLTGCRRSEILKLTWDEVDLTRGVLNLKDSKTGEKVVPLGAPAQELLASARRLTGNPYVCWGDKPGGHLVGVDKGWRKIRRAAQLDDVRIHDLRHSFAAIGASGGLGLPIIGALLGHTQPQTTQRYAHLAADPLKQAADRISSEIAAALQGEVGEVHPFPHRQSG